MAHGQGGAEIAHGYAPTLTCNHEAPIAAYALQHAQIGRKAEAGPQGKGWQKDVAFTQDSRPCADAVATFPSIAVRRLTPIECERLQGFPDNYTQIPYRKKSAQACPHGPRYKALGNSWAVPVVWWIGFRMQYIGGLV